jgi:lambda repressor-like predicted transcriptional regulator
MKGRPMQDDLDQIIAQLEGASISDVSRATGLTYNTIRNVIDRRNPTYNTMKKIKEYFAGLQK